MILDFSGLNKPSSQLFNNQYIRSQVIAWSEMSTPHHRKDLPVMLLCLSIFKRIHNYNIAYNSICTVKTFVWIVSLLSVVAFFCCDAYTSNIDNRFIQHISTLYTMFYIVLHLMTVIDKDLLKVEIYYYYSGVMSSSAMATGKSRWTTR